MCWWPLSYLSYATCTSCCREIQVDARWRRHNVDRVCNEGLGPTRGTRVAAFAAADERGGLTPRSRLPRARRAEVRALERETSGEPETRSPRRAGSWVRYIAYVFVAFAILSVRVCVFAIRVCEI